MLTVRDRMSPSKSCEGVQNNELLACQVLFKHKMPSKDLVIKEAIESVLGMTRKGRNKIIRMVLKFHPDLTATKIRRVYVNERFPLPQRCRKRMKNNPANPIVVPFERNQEWAIDFMSDALAGGRRFRTFNNEVSNYPWVIRFLKR